MPKKKIESTPSGMFAQKQDFLRPTHLFRHLMLLQCLLENPNQSQVTLAKYCLVSPTIINKYLDELADEGFITLTPVTKKSYSYNLTEKGTTYCMTLFDACSAEMVRSYAFIRDMIRNKLLECIANKLSRIVIFGASTTAELIIMAMWSLSGLHISAVVDSDKEKIGKLFMNNMVQSPECLSSLIYDAVIIASWGQRLQILADLKNMNLSAEIKVISL